LRGLFLSSGAGIPLNFHEISRLLDTDAQQPIDLDRFSRVAGLE